jgi:hypothetical protein
MRQISLKSFAIGMLLSVFMGTANAQTVSYTTLEPKPNKTSINSRLRSLTRISCVTI